jgi:AraC-like DNA-binding protein
MFYHEYPPPAVLQPYLQCFWMLEHDYREPFHSHEHLWADVHTELIFTSGERYYRKEIFHINPPTDIQSTPTDHPSKDPLPKNFLIGPHTKQLILHSDGFTNLLAARFHPWGFHAFAAQKAITLVDTILQAANASKTDIPSLAECLRNKSREAQLQLFTSHLESHVPQQLPPEYQTIQSIAATLQSQYGRQKITDLATEFEISPRRLERGFLRYIGLPAKLFARILRFNHAKNLIEQNPDIGLASLAYETGYADQAHFSHNFKQLFDLSPAQFKAKIKKFRSDIAGQPPDVVFIQD